MTPAFVKPTGNLVFHREAIPQIREVLGQVYGGWDRVRLPTQFVAAGAVLQGCLPLLMEEAPAEELIQQIGQKNYEQLRYLYRQSSLLNLWYSLELEQLLEALTAAQIQVMVLKGADLASSLYPRSELRHFNDVDLMVRPKDLAMTVAILEGLGYRYHQEFRFETISKQRAAFVYIKEGSVGYTVFEIHTSLHSNEMGVAFAPPQIWERARVITVAGVNVYGMGLEDLFVYLCWHYRSHAFSLLIWLYDIAIILLRYAHELDWTMVHRMARERGLSTTIYYCMCLCQQVFNISLPESVQFVRFAPPVFIQWLITRFVGDDLAQIIRRNSCRKRKLLQRLLVDKITSLCLIGLRAFVPSPTHLGRLYMEHSRLPLGFYWLYYFVHPLLVLKELLANLLHTGK